MKERPQASLLPDGKRLHLHHGPIDLIIGADGKREAIVAAYAAAERRFNTVLEELVSEMALLRCEVPLQGLGLQGDIARTMERAVQPYWQWQITPMAAVAGSVAEHVLASMTEAARLDRAYVNNGGDIALHLSDAESFVAASPAGDVMIASTDRARGLATSGWRGRSFSLGIADAVTVIAERASDADATATMIANAVDLPLSPKVKRQAARDILPDSDLGSRLVTVAVEPLTAEEALEALTRGVEQVQALMRMQRFEGATLMLAGQVISVTRPKPVEVDEDEEIEELLRIARQQEEKT